MLNRGAAADVRLGNRMETIMRVAIRRWLRKRRYQTVLRELQHLPSGELRSLGIPPVEIARLARAASRV